MSGGDDRFEAPCRALDARGAGVVALEGAEVHVPGALPGERVRGVIEHRSPHRPEAWARLEQVVKASRERVTPVCPGHGRCGGCVLQHLDYPAQVRWKGARVEEELRAYPALAGTAVRPCLASPRVLGYRNQAKYVYGHLEGRERRLVLGAYAPRSHALVDMAGCRLVERPLDEVAGGLLEILVARDVPAFDEQRRTGLLRYAVLRASADGEVLVTLVIAPREWPEGPAVAAALRARFPAVVGVVQNVNTGAGNVLFGGEEVVLAGRGTIVDRIGDVPVELASRSFFQINREVAALAYRALARAVAEVAAAAPLDTVVDVYAGAGAIAATLAPQARAVVAIEENAAATEAAARFAGARGLAAIRFVTGDAAAELAAVPAADVVVLNPPRAGCAPAVLAQVARLRPRLVGYLSCNPETLARDLAALVERGLVVAEVTPLDMLPHTSHVEALALLRGT